MKRIIVFVEIVFILFAFFGCKSETNNKQSTFDIVENNYERLVASCEAKDTISLLTMKGVNKIDTYDGVIIFCCSNNESSEEYGFYYVPTDTPVAVSDGKIVCKTNDLTADGNGYKYVGTECKEYYTENIKGNFYYYSVKL